MASIVYMHTCFFEVAILIAAHQAVDRPEPVRVFLTLPGFR